MAPLLILLILTSQEPVQQPQWTLIRREWKQILKEHSPVMVTNEFGDIRVRTVDSHELTVIANIQKRLSTTGSAVIIRRAEAAGMVIEVRFPMGDVSEKTPNTASKKKRRVDLTVLVPAQAALTLKTGKGLVEAKGLRSAVNVETRLGDIYVGTSGPVNIKTRQGKIKTFFKATDWSSPSSVESIHGEISVFLPAEAGLTLTAVTAGFITTDYSIHIVHSPGKRGKSASAQIGDGKRRLEIQSQQADIKLLRLDP